MRTAAAALLAVLLAVGSATAADGGVAGAPAEWDTPIVRFEPQPGATVVVDGVGELRGTVEVRQVGAGVAVINELPIDEYLLGLAEVPSTWPAAALEAQVMAARTFAIRSALTPSSAPHRIAGADICATQACQVYEGVERERRDAGGAWAAAVRSTTNRLLLYEGFPILAKYASSNGGQSEPGGYVYLPAAPDPDDLAMSPHARWQSVVPLADVERALPGAGRLVDVNRAGDVVVLRREQPDGALVDEGLAPLDFRRALNRTVATPAGVPVPVPSHRFTARTQGDAVVLDGSGYGHLVGMSQYGALGKALRGMSADDILASYYGGIRPVAVDPASLPSLIRVAVALDAHEVVVRPSGGRFRVRAADGASVAELAGGDWKVTGDGSTLRVGGAAAPTGLRAERVSAGVVRVWLDVAANVEVSDPVARPLGVLDAGPHELPVAGVERIVVVADAGGGRVERAELGPVALARAATAGAAVLATPVAPSGPSPRTGPATIAALAIAGALAACFRFRRSA